MAPKGKFYDSDMRQHERKEREQEDDDNVIGFAIRRRIPERERKEGKQLTTVSKL